MNKRLFSSIISNMLLYLAYKNVISKKSSFVIILFIAFAIMLLVLTNAVFDSTENGVQETFISSFTGDVVIRPKSDKPLSLFGDETPVTGKLSEIPVLVPYGDLTSYISQNPSVENFLPQLSGRVAMRSEKDDTLAYVFGVTPDKYLAMMPAIQIEEGAPWKNGEKGAMISRDYADSLDLSLGDTLEFIVENGFSSRIRAVPVKAIYHYSVKNPILEKIVLVNPETVRSVFDISELASSESVELSDEQSAFLESSGDLDDFFSEASDFSESVVTEKIEYSKEDMDALSNVYTESTSWNFLVIKLKDKKNTQLVVHQMNKYFKDNEWNLEAVNWRKSAGNTAFYLFILRFIFNVGIIIVLLAGFIVINNTLVINILDRIREIGTMRAIGANKRFISAECMLETFIMAITAGIVGGILGIFASKALTACQISFTNSFLVQLFGGEVLVTQVNFKNLLSSFLLSIFIGFVAWIYPVMTALRINPVQAMQGAK